MQTTTALVYVQAAAEEILAAIVHYYVCTHYGYQLAASRNQPEPWVGVAMLTSPHPPWTAVDESVGVAMLKSSHHHTAADKSAYTPVDMATLTSQQTEYTLAPEVNVGKHAVDQTPP